MNSDIEMFLGFGKPSDYEVYPKTSLNSLPLDNDIKILFLKYFAFRLKHFSFLLYTRFKQLFWQK